LIRATKTGHRIVKLRPEFLKRLEVACDKRDCDRIVSYREKPLKKLRRSFKTALKNTGIEKKVRLYDIRHMYGTFMVQNKADLFAIQNLMGHSDIETTQKYLHHAEAMKEDTVLNCLPGLTYDEGPPEPGQGGQVIDLRRSRGSKLVPKRKSTYAQLAKCLILLVGARGFEPPTP